MVEQSGNGKSEAASPADVALAMYDRIGAIHTQIVQLRQQQRKVTPSQIAQIRQGKVVPPPRPAIDAAKLLAHLEEAVFFLAGECLGLRGRLDELSQADNGAPTLL